LQSNYIFFYRLLTSFLDSRTLTLMLQPILLLMPFIILSYILSLHPAFINYLFLHGFPRNLKTWSIENIKHMLYSNLHMTLVITGLFPYSGPNTNIHLKNVLGNLSSILKHIFLINLVSFGTLYVKIDPKLLSLNQLVLILSLAHVRKILSICLLNISRLYFPQPGWY